MVKEGKMKVHYLNGNRLLPQIRVKKEAMNELCNAWTESLTGFGGMTVREKHRLWTFEGLQEILHEALPL